MGIHVANADLLACEALDLVLTPPPLIDYLDFAEANISFSERESPFPGPYNRTLFPEFDAILQALNPSDPCRVVTMAKSAQMGGTVIGNIFLLGSMDLAPGDFMVTHPTDDNARRWSKMKLKPMLKSTASLARFFPEKSRDGSDSVLYKERTDGRGAIQISGANSPASLSQVSMRRQIQDDLAKWEMNAAGDPEKQADSRSRAFEFAKILKISTPLISPGCRITRSYREGSQERPFVPCPHAECGAFQVLEWPNMLATLEADPEDPHFTCVECGAEIREHDLRAMKQRLEWRAENPKAARVHRSFWIWSAYSVLQSWRRIADEWFDAKGDPAKERVFFNDTLGLAYESQGEAPDWEKLRDRASESPYTHGQVPAGALLLTLGVDCQVDRVEWQLVGWGRDARSWTVEYGVIPGHISSAECRTALDALLLQTWPNAAGRRYPADLTGIDGNAWTEDVWTWVRKHPASKVIMLRGLGADTAPLLARVKKERSDKTGKLLKWSRRFYNFGTSVLKMALYRNLAKEDPLERGFVGLPRGLDDEYFRQLTAERRQAKKNKAGFETWQWVKDPNQANEGLDTRLQAEAAAIKLGVRSMVDRQWDALEAERETPPPMGGQLDLEDMLAAPPMGQPVAAAPPGQPPATPTASSPTVGVATNTSQRPKRRLA
ncbi:MAG: phage terminase large subunit family protein [Proteobacteria bacterium]|nr:phage terminase large subunit family protein [Pseudomonadota bacterium]